MPSPKLTIFINNLLKYVNSALILIEKQLRVKFYDIPEAFEIRINSISQNNQSIKLSIPYNE